MKTKENAQAAGRRHQDAVDKAKAAEEKARQARQKFKKAKKDSKRATKAARQARRDANDARKAFAKASARAAKKEKKDSAAKAVKRGKARNAASDQPLTVPSGPARRASAKMHRARSKPQTPPARRPRQMQAPSKFVAAEAEPDTFEISEADVNE